MVEVPVVTVVLMEQCLVDEFNSRRTIETHIRQISGCRLLADSGLWREYHANMPCCRSSMSQFGHNETFDSAA